MILRTILRNGQQRYTNDLLVQNGSCRWLSVGYEMHDVAP